MRSKEQIMKLDILKNIEMGGKHYVLMLNHKRFVRQLNGMGKGFR